MKASSNRKRLSMLPTKYLSFLAFAIAAIYLLLCPYIGLSHWFSIIPFLLMATKGVDVTIVNGLFLSLIWISYTLLLTSPLYVALGRFTLLFIYIPIIGVVFYKEPHEKATLLFLIIEYVFWDVPLLLWIRIISWMGGRALKPFYSQINDTVSVGSIPLPVDVAYLKQSQRIDIVVNMCLEYLGPVAQYSEHGIVQIHIPTPDVCEPVYRDIVLGLWQIRTHRQAILEAKCASSVADGSSLTSDSTDKSVASIIDRNSISCDSSGSDSDVVRVFIHCKAGRGRAATFALCYLISLGHEPQAAMDLLKRQRHVVETYVLQFKSVTQFIHKHKMYLGDLELMVKEIEEDS